MAPIPDTMLAPAPEPASTPVAYAPPAPMAPVEDHAAPPLSEAPAWGAAPHESRLAGSDATSYAPIPRVRPDEWLGAPPPRRQRTLVAGG